MTSRYGVYYAPSPDDPLWRAGCAWLGRDPAGGVLGPPPDVPAIEAMTAAPRGYGFHATLKPPMRLRDGVGRDDLLAALGELTRTVPRFPLPSLRVTEFHGFLCLRETQDSAALQALCDLMVAGLDDLRRPADEAEMVKRRGGGLSPARDANLRRWGYPDVFATWFFHMTLSRRLTSGEMDVLRPVAESWFAQALAEPRDVDAACVFEQIDGGPFSLIARVQLGVYSA